MRRAFRTTSFPRNTRNWCEENVCACHDEPYYVHTKHMYNLDQMKHQKLTMTLAVLAAFSIGVAVPVYAIEFQQKKTASA